MIAILYWTIGRLVRKKAVCCGQGRINRKFLWKISQESLKSFFCILYSLKKSSLKYALKIIAFLTSGHSEKFFWVFETNLKTFQNYKLLEMRPLRGRLLGVRIRVVRHHLFSSIFLEHPHPLLQALQFDLPGRPKQWDQEIAECRIESQWGMNYKAKERWNRPAIIRRKNR